MKIQLKQLLAVVLFLVVGITVQAADDLITQQITITLEEAGTLPDKIDSTEVYKITNLKIIGAINGTDLKMIREMAGRDYKGKSTDGKLATLDLSEATIVSDGEIYYRTDYMTYSTQENELGDFAFYNCSSLTSIKIPSGVTSMGIKAFSGCSNLASVEIPSSVTLIDQWAFRECSSLTSVEIPSGVTSIGWGAFSYCSSLTSVEIPSSVTWINDYAFYKCSSLTSIYVSWEKPVTIDRDDNVFYNVGKCTLYVPQGTSTNYNNAEVWKTFNKIVEHDKTHYYKIGNTKHYLFDENPSVDNLELEDGKDFVANVSFKATAASYSRTMTSNWGTLCLPFAVETTSTDDSKFYGIESVNSNVITLTQLNGTIAAGTPVLVYSTNETNELNITASNVDVVTAPINGDQTSGWQLVGSFAETEVPDDGYIISKNKFWLTSDLTKYSSVKAVKTKGLRAWLKSESSSSEAKAHVLGFAIDDETTAIDAIDGLTEGTAEIYDIQGRRTDRLQKGLNIVKMGSVTKKIIVK